MLTLEQYREIEYIVSLIELERDWLDKRRKGNPEDKGVRYRG
jgi:hypothetical protein